MRNLELKSLDSNIIDIDQKTRKVTAVWSTTNTVDLDNDVIVPGAFTKTLQERGPKGKNLIWSLIDHKADVRHTIGKPEELYLDNQGRLIAVTPIVDTEAGEDALKLYDAGLANQHSIGFTTIVSDTNNDTGIRTIKELKLYEGSLVLWAANPNTPTINVKGINPIDAKHKINTRLDLLFKAVKGGRFTDDTFSLLEIEIEQLKKAIIELQHIEPDQKSVQPATDTKVLEAIRIFNNTIKK